MNPDQLNRMLSVSVDLGSPELAPRWNEDPVSWTTRLVSELKAFCPSCDPSDVEAKAKYFAHLLERGLPAGAAGDDLVVGTKAYAKRHREHQPVAHDVQDRRHCLQTVAEGARDVAIERARTAWLGALKTGEIIAVESQDHSKREIAYRHRLCRIEEVAPKRKIKHFRVGGRYFDVNGEFAGYRLVEATVELRARLVRERRLALLTAQRWDGVAPDLLEIIVTLLKYPGEVINERLGEP